MPHHRRKTEIPRRDAEKFIYVQPRKPVKDDADSGRLVAWGEYKKCVRR